MPQERPAKGGESFHGHMGERASDAVPFVVSHLLGHTYTLAWSSARDAEALSLLRALRIRPSDVKAWKPGGDGTPIARDRSAFITQKAFDKLLDGGHAAWDTVMDIGLPGLAGGGGRSRSKAGS